MDYIDKLEIDEEVYEIRDSNAVRASELLDLVYPVGSIYITTNSTHPTLLFGGDWERIQGRFLLAADNTYTPGSEGGSADAVIPTHTHTVSGTVSTNGSHSHSLGAAGGHSHNNAAYNSGYLFSIFKGLHSTELIGSIGGSGHVIPQVSDDGWWTGAKATAEVPNHTHSIGANGNHNHTINITSQSTGVDGADKNMPPYLAVYVWKRVDNNVV